VSTRQGVQVVRTVFATVFNGDKTIRAHEYRLYPDRNGYRCQNLRFLIEAAPGLYTCPDDCSRCCLFRKKYFRPEALEVLPGVEQMLLTEGGFRG